MSSEMDDEVHDLPTKWGPTQQEIDAMEVAFLAWMDQTLGRSDREMIAAIRAADHDQFIDRMMLSYPMFDVAVNAAGMVQQAVANMEMANAACALYTVQMMKGRYMGAIGEQGPSVVFRLDEG